MEGLKAVISTVPRDGKALNRLRSGFGKALKIPVTVPVPVFHGYAPKSPVTVTVVCTAIA